MLDEVDPMNPFRLPGWRWERARMIIEDRIPFSRRMDDPDILRAYQFRTGLNRCRDELDRAELKEEFPDIYWAHKIYSTDDNKRMLLKWELEARLLTGDIDRNIADRCDTLPSLVDAYEKIFFNVRPKLDKQSYIINQVIGPSVHSGMSSRAYDVLWKLFGYLHGPILLNAIITTSINRPRPETPDEVARAAREIATNDLVRVAMIAAKTMSINSFTQTEIMDLFTKLLQIEKSTDATSGGNTLIMANIQQMVKAVGGSWSTSQRRLNAPAAELRTDELMQKAIGHNPELDDLDTITYPPPRSQQTTLAED